MPEPSLDVIVLGAGPAGYICAIRAAQLGLHTALVEKEFLGGVCLNVGCIPSKALLRNAEIAHLLLHRGAEFGFSAASITVDYAAAVRRSRQISSRMVKGVEFLLRKNGVEVLRGRGRILSPGTVEVTPAAGGEPMRRSAKNIVLATGARPASPPGLAPDGERIFTYREAIVNESLPASAVIVGGGPIGLEFATVWRSYGVPVTIVEMLPRIAPTEDEEVSAELEKAFTKQGIDIRTGTLVQSVKTAGEALQVTVKAGDREETLAASHVLVATGFRPNSEDCGLDAAGVALEKGKVLVDERMATNIPGIWAIGDVTGKLMLAHVGSAMGLVCAENMAGRNTQPLEYVFLPRGIYSRPQAASFGLTETQAAQQGYVVKTAKFPFQANGKALGLGDYAGWAKIVADQKTGRLLGAHLVGPEVTELLPELTLAHRAGLTGESIAANVHAHPTLSEVLMEAAHGLSGPYLHM